MAKENKLSIRKMIEISMFVVLIAVGAFIKFPVFIIPFSLQFIFTNLAGLILGKKYGTMSVLIYIGLGLIGLPIFTNGGGIGYVFQPSFGYLVGMALGTYLVGRYTEKRRDTKNLVVGSLINMIAVYAVGLPYMIFIVKIYISSGVAVKSLIVSGFLITLPADLIKCYISSVLTKKIDKYIK